MANRKTQKKRDREKMKKDNLKNPKPVGKGGFVNGGYRRGCDQIPGEVTSPPNWDPW